MLSFISSILWIVITLIVVIFGIYLRFNLSKNVNNSYKMSNKKESLKLLCMNLAGKIGVGSISGIAISIMIGGVGTLFWIWISSIFLAPIIYLETKIGIKYREKNNNGFIGGPQVYLKEKLRNKRLSIIYSILIIFTNLFAFILIQSNTIVISFEIFLKIKRIIIALFLSFLLYLSINKGINKILKITSYLCPIMCFIYILIGIMILLKNIDIIPILIKNILKDAFSFRSVFTLPFVIGFQRSIFSNEAGMGTTAMVSSLSSDGNYKKECKFQVFGTYFITLVICSISALIILTCPYKELTYINLNGIEIINYAFTYHFGSFGNIILIIIVFLFSYSTLITCYYYGLINTRYLFNNKSDAFIKLVVIIVVILSIFISSTNIWLIVDILTAMVTLINIYALIKLKKELMED